MCIEILQNLIRIFSIDPSHKTQTSAHNTMAYKILDNFLPDDVTLDIAQRAHKLFMQDIITELPLGLSKICPFTISFKKEHPVKYLVETYNAKVYTHGHCYNAAEHDVYPYDRPSYKWSATIIRVPATNQILGYYKHDETGYHSHILFTGYISSDGKVVAERFYYKDGAKSPAVTQEEEFVKVYNSEVSRKRLFCFLADVSGETDLETSISFPTKNLQMPWWDSPENIMKSLDRYAVVDMVYDHYYEDIYD